MGIPIESGGTNSKVIFYTVTGMPVTREICSSHVCRSKKQMHYPAMKPMTSNLFKSLKTLLSKLFK